MSRQLGVVGFVVMGMFASGVTAAPPKVVKTSPAAEAVDVNPDLGEIMVTFDVPMKQNSHSLVVVGELEFPDFAGDDPISSPDSRTFVIKVKLQPNRSYGLGFNSATRTGFKSAEDGTGAAPFELRFKTAGAATTRAKSEPKGPHVVKTDPPADATGIEAGTFDLTIVFSEPMKKGQASITTPPEGPRLKVLGKPRWEDARTFIVPVMLDAKQRYRLGINLNEPKRFVTAGDDTAAEPFELSFSTQGASASGKSTSRPASGPAEASRAPIRLRYNYQKGDAGRVIRRADIDVKINVSNGQSLKLGQQASVNCIEEVTGVDAGKPLEARKIISEYVLSQTNPQTGQPQAAPKLQEPVTVTVDRRSDPVEVETVEGEVPEELKKLLAEDTFVDLLPTEPIKVGQSYDLPAAAIADIRKTFDATGTGRCSIKLIAQRIGPLEVEDARNEMFKAKGGGTPATYVFNVVEFAVDWNQEGAIQSGVAIPFSMVAKGKVVFAIEAGVMLRSDVDAKLTIKPMEQKDENGQTIKIDGGGTYAIRNSFQPINWTRGVSRKQGKSAAGDTDSAVGSNKPADGSDASPPLGAESSEAKPAGHDASEPLSTPAGSIAHQLRLLKAGDVEALKKCFTEDIQDRITEATVKAGQKKAKNVTVEELVDKVVEDEGTGLSRSAKIKMKNGRTLTTLIFADGKWLSDTVWFK